MDKRRVVITGLGAVTPFGVGVEKFWESLKAGKSGISTSESIDISKHVVKISGEVKDFHPEEYMEPKAAKKMDRFIQFAMVAADEAIKDSKLDVEKEDPYRVGVIVSSAAGGFKTFEENHIRIIEKGPNKCSPFTVPMMIVNMPSGNISMKYGFKGLNKVVVSACATGSHSIGDAFRSIQYGDADVMVAGGSEATICDVGVGAFSAARTLSKRNDEPQRASRPYDKDRDGFVMAEGAGVLILEEYEHAKKRNAEILAEICGYGFTADAHHITAPLEDGAMGARAMSLAIESAKISPDKINYVNTHGTSTPTGDIAEVKAIKKSLGEDVAKKIKINSTKSMTGHALGAAGGIEAIATIMSIIDSKVHPTINIDEQDSECDLDVVANTAQDYKIEYAISNSFGFGGHNASIVFKKI